MDFQELFWSKVNKTDTCWLWTGRIHSAGYGTLRVPKQIRGDSPNWPAYAHRLSYQFMVGQVPDGKELDHLCRVRHCVNPDHLEAVTHRENLLRGQSPMADQVKRTHCPQGHAYSDVRSKENKRKCPTCLARWQREFRAAMREGEYINGKKFAVRADNPREPWHPRS